MGVPLAAAAASKAAAAGNAGAALSIGTTAAQMGGSIWSTLFGNKQARKESKRAREWQLEMWNRQNEYNHPSAQMQRLKDAGLNPNLIYGTSPTSAVGAAGTPGSAPQAQQSAESPTKNIDPIGQLLAHQRIKNTQIEADNLKKQGEAIDASVIRTLADAQFLNSRTKGQGYENILLDRTMDLKVDQLGADLDLTRARTKLTGSQTQGQNLANYLQGSTMGTQIKQARANLRNTMSKTELNRFNAQIAKETARLNAKGLTWSDSVYFRLPAKTQEFIADQVGKVVTKNPAKAVQKINSMFAGTSYHGAALWYASILGKNSNKYK